jgi:ribosomal protein S2
LNIPVIGVVDSDTTANLLTYPILANDNSIELRHQLTVDISLTILEAKLIRYGLSCT